MLYTFDHSFIFEPGIWLGQGKVRIQQSSDFVNVYMKWDFSPADEKGGIACKQYVEREGVKDILCNALYFLPMTPVIFSVELTQDGAEKSSGFGFINAERIAWEYLKKAEETKEIETFLEGHESYILQQNGEYLCQAEFSSGKEYTTHLEGVLWKRMKYEG